MTKRIGGDWVESTDIKTGRTYYANLATKVTSWEFPEELKTQLKDGSTDSKKETSDTPERKSDTQTNDPSLDPNNWVARIDTNSDRKYYFNKVTKTTTWEVPACISEAVVNDQPETDEKKSETIDDPFAILKEMKALKTKHVGQTDIKEDEVRQTTDFSSEFSTEELCGKYEDYHLAEYAESHFNYERKGFLKMKTTTEKIISWKNEIIKTSLLQISDELVQEACQSFRNITGYMGDRSSNKGEIDHAIKLISTMIASPEQLRDEFYCQLMKQTNKNPNETSLMKGWKLMILALSSFPPSSELDPYLCGYCINNMKQSESDLVKKFAEYSLHAIRKILKLGVRHEIPTFVEIESITSLQPTTIRVHFVDKKYTFVHVDPWTTASDMRDKVAKKLGIQAPTPFAIFEVSTSEEERVLEPDERILDLLACWNRHELEERQKKGKLADFQEFRFFFKVCLFLDFDESDIPMIEMMYIQAQHDVVDARYPCSEQDALTLAALQVQEEFGDHPGPGQECTYIRGFLGKYVAQKFLEGKESKEIEEQILNLYAKLSGYSQREARLSYLDFIRSWKIYGSTYFFVEPINNRDLPHHVVLAVNSKGILVVHPDTKEFLNEYAFADVSTWGHAQNSFVLMTGSGTRQGKSYFKTDQGKEINALLLKYVENMIANKKKKN